MIAQEILARYGFTRSTKTIAGFLVEHESNNSAIMLDHHIFDQQDLLYVDYTCEQNTFMSRFDRLFRFVADTSDDISYIDKALSQLLGEDWDISKVIRHGADRHQTSIDPTHPEFHFENAFSEAFGEVNLCALERESPFVDYVGNSRYIDYVIHFETCRIAIELNGEKFHHPVIIKKGKYVSQLVKQNSLVSYGMKLFRWSLFGMRDHDRFIDEIRSLFAPMGRMVSAQKVVVRREMSAVRLDQSRPNLPSGELRDYQQDAVERLIRERSEGKRAFLVVLLTGTGKTEIAVADFHAIKSIDENSNALFVVPSRELRSQVLERLQTRLPNLHHSEEYLPASVSAGFMVQTYQYMNRHFEDFASDSFSYIVIDEAHHAMAPGISRFLRHFCPANLLGLTATPERLDQRRLEEVFGEFESDLSLQEAIETGVIPPVRAFRVETNIDLSEVRFRGIDYVAADLQKSVKVPSRDQLIAEVISRFFSQDAVPKSGIVFCVNVEHAQSMAKTLILHGITAVAVSGRNHTDADRHIAMYRSGEIQFLCTCSLLTEGFDAPRTSVVVMARPTLSKALYMQQLGRGTRAFPGKEALYVIDVVDRYGPLNAPWSIHALFGISMYSPWANLLLSKTPTGHSEEEVLVHLLEYPQRIDEINLFTFERVHGDCLSEEQTARELWIATDTLRKWIRAGEIKPHVTVPFGKKPLNYFLPAQIEEIREKKGLKKRTDETILDDFFEFLEERDYTYSYKIIMMLSLLRHVDRQGGAGLDEVAHDFAQFFNERHDAELPVERENCPLRDRERLNDASYMRSCLLKNPFEKFERKRFMQHAKDLERIEFTLPIWAHLRDNPQGIDRIRKQMILDLQKYFNNLGGAGAESDIYARFRAARWIPVMPETPLDWEPPTMTAPSATSIPLFRVTAAAGSWLQDEMQDIYEWIDIREFVRRDRVLPGMFVMQVRGKSMEPTILDGSWCLFAPAPHGTRQGRILLVELRSAEDPEHGGRYTVKRYRSQGGIEDPKRTVELRPDNPDFTVINVRPGDSEDIRILAEFIETLAPPVGDRG